MNNVRNNIQLINCMDIRDWLVLRLWEGATKNVCISLTLLGNSGLVI